VAGWSLDCLSDGGRNLYCDHSQDGQFTCVFEGGTATSCLGQIWDGECTGDDTCSRTDSVGSASVSCTSDGMGRTCNWEGMSFRCTFEAANSYGPYSYKWACKPS